MQEKLMLERKTKEELKQIAQGLGIEKISALKKDEIAKLIAEKREEIAKQETLEKAKDKKKQRPADAVEVCGVLDVMADGFGFLRFDNLRPSEDDVYVSPTQIKRFGLKTGDEISGDSRPSQDEDKYSPLLYVKKINGDSLEVALKRKSFEKLVPIYPKERLVLENSENNSITSRVIDLFSPIGKGQRGMIVAPPKAGKTTIIKNIAQSVSTNYPDVKLIVLLIDERPEEVTDIKRSINGEVIYSTFDQTPENHTKVAEMVLERAMRLVEQKKDVVILLDSITRLARAYNLTVTPTGRTLSGGLDPDALIKPKKFFGAARNIEEGGSLTILATALVETGSRMDDVIFEEFKGTGNMELKLDRSMQERRIFPAIDIAKSGTRREEELLSSDECEVAWAIRHDISRQNVADSVGAVLNEIRNTKDNNEFCGKMLKKKTK
ncbi:MAG: transcription termination factor Rho [Eubacteriales bacterium]|nr:transcription termination factor Rho [Eubacteriales bacterium]